jgi:hypothetical protein
MDDTTDDTTDTTDDTSDDTTGPAGPTPTAAPRDAAANRALTVLVASAFFCVAAFLPWVRASLKVPGAHTVAAPANAFHQLFGTLAWLSMVIALVAAVAHLVRARVATMVAMAWTTTFGVAASLAYLVRRTPPRLDGSLGGPGVHVWPTVGLFGALIAAIVAAVSSWRLMVDRVPGGANADETGDERHDASVSDAPPARLSA